MAGSASLADMPLISPASSRNNLLCGEPQMIKGDLLFEVGEPNGSLYEFRKAIMNNTSAGAL